MDNLRILNKNYFLRPWAKKGFIPKNFKKAKRVYIWDSNNKKYLDFSSGSFNVNVGYGNKKIINAISKELNKISFLGANYATKSRSQLSSIIAKLVPVGLTKSFFTSSGSEAIEVAMRFVTEITKKKKLISAENSYHGATFGAASLSGDQDMNFRVSLQGILHVPYPCCYKCPFKLKYPNCNLRCINSLNKIVNKNKSKIAAIFIEPIMGINGFLIPPKEYLLAVRDICNKNDIFLVFDEILTGFGRTGKWFACQHYNVKPDIICFGKGINSGYLPFGGLTVSKEIANHIEENPINYGQTYTAHTVCCASALANIKFIIDKNLINSVNKKSKIIEKELNKFQETYSLVGNVRGIGFLWAMELMKNSKKELKIIFDKLHKGGLFFYSDLNTNFLSIAPPFIIRKSELKHGLGIIEKVLRKCK